jgi:hypothetical protein
MSTVRHPGMNRSSVHLVEARAQIGLRLEEVYRLAGHTHNRYRTLGGWRIGPPSESKDKGRWQMPSKPPPATVSRLLAETAGDTPKMAAHRAELKRWFENLDAGSARAST